MIKDIAFTAYPAKDVQRLRDFYMRVLGLAFTGPFSEDGVLKYDEAQVGSGWFALMTTQWLGETPAGSIAFEVDDIERAFADLRSAGVEVGEIHDTSVCKLGAFKDPEGNSVTLHQSTGAPA
jgi:predicted enzyme related to lactoylglutathione lyase